tara:strand:- start:2212 stop:2754 length:543 start_codon:yes stop_codon:yes gene_type:complete
MSDLTITHAGVTKSKVTGGEFLSADKKLNQMKVDLITVVPDIAEATYSTGDLMAEGETIENAVAVKSGSCILQSISAIDTSDTGGTIYLVITDNQANLGTVGNAINAADNMADNSVAIVELSNWTDIGGAKVCTKGNIGLVCQSSSTTKNLYFGVVNVSGGNIVIGSSEDIIFRFGVIKD